MNKNQKIWKITQFKKNQKLMKKSVQAMILSKNFLKKQTSCLKTQEGVMD